MNKEIIYLNNLPTDKKSRIKDIQGGFGLQRKLSTMGVRENQDIIILSKQPFRGPITIQICGCTITIGQGMAQKIIVEVL